MILVGLGYKMKRGKDTLAEFLINMRGKHTPWKLDIRRYAFADYLKQEVNHEVEKIAAQHMVDKGLIGLDNRAYNNLCKGIAMLALCNEKGVEYDWTPPMDDPYSPFGKQRRLLQWWGTEYRRAQDPDYWVKILTPAISSDAPQVAIITDVHFPNEFEWVKTHGDSNFMIRLERLNPNGSLFKLPEENHASENSLEGFSFDRSIFAPSVTYLKYKGLEIFDQVLESCA